MGDAANGKKLFAKMCATCHNAAKDGKHKIGPNLFGVLGRTCGSEYNSLDQISNTVSRKSPGTIVVFKQTPASTILTR